MSARARSTLSNPRSSKARTAPNPPHSQNQSPHLGSSPADAPNLSRCEGWAASSLKKRLHFPKCPACARSPGGVGSAGPSAGWGRLAVALCMLGSASREVRRPTGKEPEGKETPQSCYGGLKGEAKQPRRIARFWASVVMSFKREGDDWSQLNVLKKRRVGDLLASYIPEDEALMLRDGRFACAICPHRPVLDTLAMLTAHRAGKKHLSSLQLFYGKKQPGKGTEQNPRQQNELRRSETKAEAPLLTQTRLTTQSALHRGPHYNSCCRRKYRPEAPRPSVSHFPLPPPEVEPKSGKISREPVPGAGPQAKESATVSSSAPMSPTRRRALDHYLTLRSSGWIPDGQGRWVKDENVEFDSDEEEPPDLPLD